MKSRKSVGLCITVLFTIQFAAICVQAAPPGSGWNKVWSDEFNDYTIKSDWSVIESRNDGNSVYLKSNVSENGSELVLKNISRTSRGSRGEMFSGGKVETNPHKYWNKGYFEARCRLAWGNNHLWPTFWMWKWSSGTEPTEFDIMEYTGSHSYPSQSHHYLGKTGKTSQNSSTSVSSYHEWAVYWADDEVSFWIDGDRQFKSNKPSDAGSQTLPIILSTSPVEARPPDPGENLPSFLIDWVRVWQGGSYSDGGAPTGQTIALKSKGSNKYVKANGPGTQWTLQAINNTSSGSWEKFQVVDAGGGYIALKSNGSNKYVKANGSGTQWKLQAINSSYSGNWEQFQWIENSDGTISLKSKGSGKYVKANGGPNWVLHAINNNVGGAWEKFTVEIK